MASIYDIAGTINNSFTIGNDGITIFHGNYIPTLDIGKIGDIYIQKNHTEIIKDAEGVVVQQIQSPFGRVYYKNIKDGVECWEHIKNYSFDEPIISVLETELNSNNYKISIQKALQPSEDPNSTTENDFEVAHNNYGVVRFSTDNEATSGERIDTVINPKQLIDNIVHLIAEHNTDNDEGDEPRHPYIQKRIDDEITRATTAEGVLQSNIDKEAKTRDDADKVLQSNIDKEANARILSDENLQTQIDAINARKDVVDVVGTKADLNNYNTKDLTDKDIVKVLSDETQNDRQSYYRWVLTNNIGAWEFIGSDAASYTKAEIDVIETNIYNKISQEDNKLDNRITTEVATLNTRIDNEVSTLNDSIDLKANITDVNDELEILNTRIDNEVSTLNNAIDLKADASNVYTKDEIIGLLDDASADVDELLTHKQDKITITELDKDKVLSNDGTNLTWREIADITELKGMYDVAIENPVDGQTLVYDEEKKKWVNGLQKTATIKYW